MNATLRALVIVTVLVAMAAGAALYSVVRRGLSARAEPGAVEVAIARAMRLLATPSAVRHRQNPLPATEEALDEGLEHFADHCAVCHANDGSGDSSIGSNLYPKAPDMRAAATQSLTDGELFTIIENGIRLTGMPAFGDGTPEGERSSWALVQFVRHLPAITTGEIVRMQALNPRTPEGFREEEEIRRFLAGEDAHTGEKPD